MEFKTRFYNHNQSFKNQNKRNTTELSKSVWKTKEEGHEPTIHWSIVTKTKPYKPGSKLCQLCSAEKLTILQSDPSSTYINAFDKGYTSVNYNATLLV